jgi:hypothetical protein
LLHLLEADTGETHDTLRVMQALDTSGGYRSYVTPGLAVAEGAAYVSVPTAGQIAEVHLGDFTVARHMDVPGRRAAWRCSRSRAARFISAGVYPADRRQGGAGRTASPSTSGFRTAA